METGPWSRLQRFLFRFIFCYWMFWALPERGRVSLLTSISIPGISSAINYLIVEPYTKASHALVQWTGAHVFHLSAETLQYQMTGSGDTAKDWIAVFCYLVLSLAIAIVWGVFDRRRTEYNTLNRWLRVTVRYTLALTLLAYGGAKIVPMQFGSPGFYYLLLPYGQASPMGVLWRFMGSSLPYTIFAGVAETLSGLLLLFRRTAIIGALSSAAVMFNVAMLNYCYDVPVKLYSTNLLLMAIFLLIPDIKRLLDVTLLNRPVRAVDPNRDRLYLPKLSARHSRLAVIILKTAYLTVMLGMWAYGCWGGYQMLYGKPSRPPLYGLYRVVSLTRRGVPIQASTAEPNRWRYIGFESAGTMTCWRFDGTRANFRITMDEPHSQFTIASAPASGNQVPQGQIHFHQIGSKAVELDGLWNGEPVGIQLDALPREEFLLNKRGFNWVQELPFNR